MHVRHSLIAVTVTASAALLAGLLAGCGGGSASSQPPAARPSTAAPASTAAGTAAQGDGAQTLSCGLVPASLVNSALSTDLGAPAQSSAPNAVACQFKGAKAGAVEIRIQAGDDAAGFAAGRRTFEASGQRTKDYPGFADEAYTSTQQMPLGLPAVNTLVARHGSVEVLVAASVSIAAERALEEQVFAKAG
jgi:hypothetical protein